MTDKTESVIMREEFERWFSDNGTWPQAIERSGLGYKMMAAESAWVAWQAAWNRRAALREQDDTPYVASNCRNADCDSEPEQAGVCWYCPSCYSALRESGEPVAWVDVPEGDQQDPNYQGYSFNGIRVLPAGKYYLYATSQPSPGVLRRLRKLIEPLALADKYQTSVTRQELRGASEALAELDKLEGRNE